MINYTTRRPFVIKWWMDKWGFKGLATPWKTIYFDDVLSLTNKELVRHEEKHIEQMQRDGKMKFLIKYNWYWVKFGYWANPYELEARKAENE